ncbi:hypothetical protein FRZ06_11500 [Anoxybacterium hadale]|uniref:Uncharacterized protein n=1 Tax=Anoxybacterium hadale TaxID=3408580 RepID=A0ACD1ABP9_9FIRM|nr:hypothetical protein FRZ06_11500 [Clostridiales bacterium]
MSFETKVNELLEDIITENELPKTSIFLYANKSNKGDKKGIEISKSIKIFEPEYPPQEKSVRSKNGTLIMNIQQKSGIELLIRNEQYNTIPLPEEAKLKELKSDENFKHIIFDESMDSLYTYIKANVVYCIENYVSSSSFGCCSKFEKCSDERKCLHENKLYSTGCAYRRNLENRKIFYGLNRNVL